MARRPPECRTHRFHIHKNNAAVIASEAKQSTLRISKFLKTFDVSGSGSEQPFAGLLRLRSQ
jgi:hypothetical protein